MNYLCRVEVSPHKNFLTRESQSVLFLFVIYLLVGCSSRAATTGITNAGGKFEKNIIEEQIARAKGADAEVAETSKSYYYFLLGELALHRERYDEALANYKLASEHETEPAPVLRSRLAQLYVRKGELRLALEELDKISDLAVESSVHGENLDVLRLKAGIYASLNNRDKAVEIYRQLILLEPENQDNYVLLSSLYAQSSDYDKAKAVLEELIAASPEASALAYYYIARISESRGALEEAEEFYAKAVKLNPDAEAIQIDYARTLALRDRRDEAIEKCESILAKNPQNVVARRLLGQLLWEGQKFEEALKELEELRSLEKDPTETRLKIALIKLERKDFAGAEVELNLILAVHPQNSTARYFLASVYTGMGKDEDAINALQQIKPGQKMFVESRVLVAYLAKQKKQFDIAAKAIEEALSEKTDDINLLLYLASLQREAGKLDEAVGLMKRVIALDKAVDRHYFTLGAIYDELEKPKEAMEAMRKSIEANPSNADALNYLGYSLAERGEALGEAERFIKRALEIEPNNAYYIDSLGWVYFKMGKYEEALEQLQLAIKAVSDDAVILEHFAEILIKLGQREKALSVFEKALMFAPKSDDGQVEIRVRAGMDKIRKMKQ